MLNIVLLILVSACGAIYDWKKRRIPNWLTFGTFFLMLIINVLSLRPGNVLNCLFGFLLGIALLFVPYLIKAMGAGDVKLLGALGSIAGYKDVLLIFVYSSILGLFLGLIWILFRPGHFKFLITTLQVLPTVDKQQKFPYGVVLSLGTILYIVFGMVTSYNLYLSKLIWQ